MKSPEGRTLAASLKTVIDVLHIGAWVAGALVLLGASFFAIAALGGGDFDFGIGGVSADRDSWQAVAPAFLSGFIFSAAGIVILGRLGKILGTLVAGDPFVPVNARRLQTIGYAIAGMEIGRYVVLLLTGFIIAVYGQPAGGVMQPEFRPSIETWLAVVVVFILAQVFREGARLREDRELTI